MASPSSPASADRRTLPEETTTGNDMYVSTLQLNPVMFPTAFGRAYSRRHPHRYPRGFDDRALPRDGLARDPLLLFLGAQPILHRTLLTEYSACLSPLLACSHSPCPGGVLISQASPHIPPILTRTRHQPYSLPKDSPESSLHSLLFFLSRPAFSSSVLTTLMGAAGLC